MHKYSNKQLRLFWAKQSMVCPLWADIASFSTYPAESAVVIGVNIHVEDLFCVGYGYIYTKRINCIYVTLIWCEILLEESGNSDVLLNFKIPTEKLFRILSVK
jgi:hypothetical protein